jgi:hypothetical protein
MSGGGAREKTGVGRKGSLVRTPDPCLERKCVTDASTGPVRDVCGQVEVSPARPRREDSRDYRFTRSSHGGSCVLSAVEICRGASSEGWS